ncbi:hypothetical protein DEA8626_03810 [Defluviimonas aquaemixtae]|uniref:Glycosyl transferase family 25 domain-containing protein n=1 Tax=Albidovulum aquaemixtae TaxID=1542388 RepID=A0A2R8BMX0_9RHOB|nr:glycosyltransferase family 25 protein [Defluviimonas aquaemixtae]SPH24773.1 hypothetical protein DEA8626_03810 [Defluviimonas aquaemixtae]
MKALVINLATETDRMTFQSRQLDALGVEWERLDAVSPRTLTPPPDDPYWTRWQRPLRDAEKAATASHRSAWQRIAEGKAPMLVLEDDAVLMRDVPAFLAAVEGLPGIDHISLETRGRRKLLGQRHAAAPMVRLWQDYTGAAAYVLWPSGARILMEDCARAAGIADGIICAAHRMCSWQADPALAVQLDRCVAHGLAAPIAVNSSILAETRPDRRNIPLSARASYRARRIAGQIRILARRLACVGRARRRHVALATQRR